LCANLRLKWGLKQSCSPFRDLSNCMWHATCTQGNQSNSLILMVRSQIGNLTPNPSFGHNLCFKCPNRLCKPILDIYVVRAFQWYKEPFNPMNFDPCNHLLKFGGPLGFQLPKWELIWECGGSFPHILLHSQEHEMWFPSSLLAYTFANPYLGRKPKAKITTSLVGYQLWPFVIHDIPKYCDA
jgi:hypothetical protein